MQLKAFLDRADSVVLGWGRAVARAFWVALVKLGVALQVMMPILVTGLIIMLALPYTNLDDTDVVRIQVTAVKMIVGVWFMTAILAWWDIRRGKQRGELFTITPGQENYLGARVIAVAYFVSTVIK